MEKEVYDLFRRNFPFIVRENRTVLGIIANPDNHIIMRRDSYGTLIGVSLIHKESIYMLCVDEDYRMKGIGSKLLKESENYIQSQGYDYVKIGAGDTYLMPGIPTNVKPFDEVLKNEFLYNNINNRASEFFIRRGYCHSFNDSNCFDMRAELDEVIFPKFNVGDTIEDITYRWAKLSDLSSIITCTDEAEEDFTQYYMDESLYELEHMEGDSFSRVLIATFKNEVCGTLIVNVETEEKGLGSVGCTTVKPKYRGKHIGVNLVRLGTKYLKEIGLRKGYLGYTYSGLDRLYAHSGYRICIYYNMAIKKLPITMDELI